VSLQEWVYNSPWHISKYCCSYCFGKWSTCIEGGLSPFPSSHLTMNGYPYHQRQLPNFDERHYWPDSHIYGATSIDNDNTCNNNGCLGKNSILCRTNIKWWLHSPCYWDIWVSLFSFWFIFDHLCTDHYRVSSMVFFSPFNVCFSLSIMCVHSLATCASHNNFSTGYYTWSWFFISSTHHS